MPYQVLALRYTTQEARASCECFLDPDADELPVRFDYFFWLLRGHRPIVIDCGFDDRTITAPGRRLLTHPGTLLQTVVLTHLHYDHAGCLDLFPSATFIVQKAEIAHCFGSAMGHAPLRRHYRADHLHNLLDATFAGRVRCIEGAYNLAPGVALHLMPGHTPGQQVVRIETGLGPLLLASDALHLVANLERRNPFPVLTDAAASYEAFDALMKLSGEDTDRIAPGHDPGVASHFQSVPECPDIIRLT